MPALTAPRCRPFALDPDVPDHALAAREINPEVITDHRIDELTETRR
jgi:hypothetical protein